MYSSEAARDRRELELFLREYHHKKIYEPDPGEIVVGYTEINLETGEVDIVEFSDGLESKLPKEPQN